MKKKQDREQNEVFTKLRLKYFLVHVNIPLFVDWVISNNYEISVHKYIFITCLKILSTEIPENITMRFYLIKLRKFISDREFASHIRWVKSMKMPNVSIDLTIGKVVCDIGV